MFRVFLSCPVLQILAGSYSAAVRRLRPMVEQLEADVDVVRDDLSQLIDEVPEVNQTESPSGVQQDNYNFTKLTIFFFYQIAYTRQC